MSGTTSWPGFFVRAIKKGDPSATRIQHVPLRGDRTWEDIERIADSLRRRAIFDDGFDYAFVHIDVHGALHQDRETKRFILPESVQSDTTEADPFDDVPF